MPQRTNRFQQVVALLQRHMTADIVEESVMVALRPPRSGNREVDVVITGRIGGRALRVGIEATRGGRRATVEWVERMIGKHKKLQLDALVLYAARGYTKEAHNEALANGVTIVSEERIDDPELTPLGHLKNLTPKFFEFTPAMYFVDASKPDGTAVQIRISSPDDLGLFYSDGIRHPCDLARFVRREVDSKITEVYSQIGLRDISKDTTSSMTIDLSPVRFESKDLHIRRDESKELHRISAVRVVGEMRVTVHPLQLEVSRFENDYVGVAEFTRGGRSALVVASTHGKISLRMSEQKNEKPKKKRSATRATRKHARSRTPSAR